MTPIGVIAALPGEGRAWISRRFLFLRVDHTYLPGAGVCLRISGIGSGPARRAAEVLLRGGVRALVSWGSAGGLAPDLVSGQLLLPERILDGAGGEYGVDQDWHGRLRTRLAHGPIPDTGPLLGSPDVLEDAADKRALYRRHGARGVDMESAALAALARAAAVPFLVVRAVADPADAAVPASITRAIDAAGRVRLARLVAGVAGRPAQWPHLLRLGGYFRAAQGTLGRVLEVAGLRLGLDDESPSAGAED
ncbi:MAG: phosphorylase family protein [Gammaproteobacteria bacterium]|nr:purine phosphorylase [Gammaproteobacteria bacterium]